MIDYARLDHYALAHHERFARFVAAHGVVCQDCGGMGKHLEEVIDYWPRYVDCGWCEGTGRIPKHTRGVWLASKRREK